jgi:hypothetical protein
MEVRSTLFWSNTCPNYRIHPNIYQIKEGRVWKEMVSLKCLNPQGIFKFQEPVIPSPRLGNLEGKAIGIFWDGKAGGDKFCMAVEELLNNRIPTAKTMRAEWNDVAIAEKVKKEMDTFILALGDSGAGGWIWAQQAMGLEKRGQPGVFVLANVALWNARISARVNGMPSLRIVRVPNVDYFPNRMTVDEVRPVVEAVIDSIIEALTKPLTEEEKNPKYQSEQEAPELIEIRAESYDSALKKFNELYLENHWGDGLPLIPPTEEAVTEMLTGTNRSPDEVVGLVPFRKGAASIKKIASNAVMAGAKPEYLPVIIAAMEGITDKLYSIPEYSINAFSHMMSSEGSWDMMIMVSGPISKEINMNCGVGLVAHGWQANNTIGRAVQLSIINLGYVWPGQVDMALIGRPNSHTYYTFAENIEESPWESFNEGLGYQPQDSCVTVSTVSGSMTIYGGGVVAPWNVKPVLDSIVKHLASTRRVFGQYKVGVANPAAHLPKYVMVIHPELAIMLKRIGFTTKRSLRDYLYESTKVPYEDLSEQEKQGIQDRINLKAGGLYYFMDAIPDNFLPRIKESLKPGGKVPVINPDDIHIVVSGTIPGYSFGMTYFHTAHQTKLIKGATLTKSGR